MVIGVISTSTILSLGGFLVAMALTYNTRYEQLGLMLTLVLVLVVLATMIHILRRNIVRMRLEADPSGLRWTNLSLGQVRRLAWEDLVRFQVTPLHRHGRLSRHELRLWTRSERVPLVIGEDVEDADRHGAFMDFQKELVRLLQAQGLTQR